MSEDKNEKKNLNFFTTILIFCPNCDCFCRSDSTIFTKHRKNFFQLRYDKEWYTKQKWTENSVNEMIRTIGFEQF